MLVAITLTLAGSPRFIAGAGNRARSCVIAACSFRARTIDRTDGIFAETWDHDQRRIRKLSETAGTAGAGPYERTPSSVPGRAGVCADPGDHIHIEAVAERYPHVCKDQTALAGD